MKSNLWTIISITFSTFMCTLDAYIVVIALPTISRDFHISTSRVSLVMLLYVLFLTSTILIVGKIADRSDLKKIFIRGYYIFVLGSFLCAISPGIYELIASRCLQGIGAAMLTVSAFSLIPKLFSRDIMGWAFGILSTAGALGVTLGTPLGGLISGYLSWHWVFLVNVPLGIIAIVIAQRVLPSLPVEGHSGAHKSFDIPGAVLSFFGIAALLFALNKGQELGWTSPAILLCFTGAMLFFGGFILCERRSREPLVDLSLFTNMRFDSGVIASVASITFVAGSNFILPFYLEFGRGLTPQAAGLVLMVYSLVYLVVSPMAGKLADRINHGILCSIAMLSGIGARLFFAYTNQYVELTPVLIFLVWSALSNGFFTPPNNSLVMGLVPGNRQGTGAGIFKMFGRLSIILGVCSFETVFSIMAPHEGKLLQAVPAAVIFQGIKGAFIFGAFLGIIGLGASLMTIKAANDKRICVRREC